MNKKENDIFSDIIIVLFQSLLSWLHNFLYKICTSLQFLDSWTAQWHIIAWVLRHPLPRGPGWPRIHRIGVACLRHRHPSPRRRTPRVRTFLTVPHTYSSPRLHQIVRSIIALAASISSFGKTPAALFYLDLSRGTSQLHCFRGGLNKMCILRGVAELSK